MGRLVFYIIQKSIIERSYKSFYYTAYVYEIDYALLK